MLTRLRSLQVGSQLLGGQSTTNPTPPAVDLTPAEKLAIFGDVVDEVVAESAAAPTAAAPSVAPPITPPPTPSPVVASSPSKEYASFSAPVESGSPDVGVAQSAVEFEPTPEISPEVESFVQHAESHEDQLPQEIVVAGDSIQLQNTHYAKQPVVVLPYDQEIEKKARFKGPSWSIKWLLEFGHKIIKMFGGKVIYLQKNDQSHS